MGAKSAFELHMMITKPYCIDFPVTDADLNLEKRKMGIYEKILQPFHLMHSN